MEEDQRDLEKNGVIKMAYLYWGFDDEFRGPREYSRSKTHTAQTKQNAFKGAYNLIMKEDCTSAKVYNEKTMKKYDLTVDKSGDYGMGYWNINGRRVPRKAVLIYDRTEKSCHILKSDGTLGKSVKY